MIVWPKKIHDQLGEIADGIDGDADGSQTDMPEGDESIDGVDAQLGRIAATIGGPISLDDIPPPGGDVPPPPGVPPPAEAERQRAAPPGARRHPVALPPRRRDRPGARPRRHGPRPAAGGRHAVGVPALALHGRGARIPRGRRLPVPPRLVAQGPLPGRAGPAARPGPAAEEGLAARVGADARRAAQARLQDAAPAPGQQLRRAGLGDPVRQAAVALGHCRARSEGRPRDAAEGELRDPGPARGRAAGPGDRQAGGQAAPAERAQADAVGLRRRVDVHHPAARPVHQVAVRAVGARVARGDRASGPRRRRRREAAEGAHADVRAAGRDGDDVPGGDPAVDQHLRRLRVQLRHRVRDRRAADRVRDRQGPEHPQAVLPGRHPHHGADAARAEHQDLRPADDRPVRREGAAHPGLGLQPPLVRLHARRRRREDDGAERQGVRPGPAAAVPRDVHGRDRQQADPGQGRQGQRLALRRRSALEQRELLQRLSSGSPTRRAARWRCSGRSSRSPRTS
jgi:hypothetical protein